jgi:hypothetical protein
MGSCLQADPKSGWNKYNTIYKIYLHCELGISYKGKYIKETVKADLSVDMLVTSFLKE